MVKLSLPVTSLTSGRIRFGQITMYAAVKIAARIISFPPVNPASTPAAMNTYGNQYSMCPVRKMDFHLVKRANNRLNANAIIITIPICVPYTDISISG